MTLTYSINEEFTVELDGDQLRDDYGFYREHYPNLEDDEILKNIYNDYMCHDIHDVDINYDSLDITATLDLTEDQFIALAREELDLESYPEDADGQLHLF